MRKLLALLMVVSVLMVGIAPTFAQDEDPGSIVDIVVASAGSDTPEFTVLLAAVQAADPSVAELLSSPDAQVTVFAPTDAAFAAFLEQTGLTAEALLADPDILTAVLAWHVVPSMLPAEAIVALNGAYLGTFIEDTPLFIEATDEGVFVDGAGVVAADVMANNGIIHVIDTVLAPDMNGMDMLGMLTMEDDMSGDDMEDDMMEDGTIADVVVGAATGDAPEFTLLLAAIQAADPIFLAAASGDFSAGEQPLTVFAPTDAAFTASLTALGSDAETILANTPLVNSLLAYHILPGAFLAEGIAFLIQESGGEARIATLLNGTALTFTLDEAGGILVDGQPVVQADITASNGYVHVINDGVLVPSN